MIKKLLCVNISSKDPKALAEFYRTIGAPVFVNNDCYDGWNLGNPENAGSVCVWDENRWGKDGAGYITMLFTADHLEETYENIRGQGIAIEPPKTADWGGQELLLTDPDGNKVIFLN
ncbi:MAG: VOC family protein [Bacillota bacterium]|nr:VOC family protein [Bacillota bacterium]